MDLHLGVISPQDWGLPDTAEPSTEPIPALGASEADLAARARHATEDWLPQQFDAQAGAFYGYFRVPDGYHEPPQTANLIAPWHLLAAYDRTGEAHLLDMAARAAAWFYAHHVVDHPMAVVAGGVRDGVPYRDDPRAQWGFWSWDPYYDYTQSPDQATHHARAMWFLLDVWHAAHF